MFDPYAKDVVLVGNRQECCYIIYLPLRLWLFCVGDPLFTHWTVETAQPYHKYCVHTINAWECIRTSELFVYIFLHHALMKLNIMVFLQTFKHITHMIHKTVQWNHIPHWIAYNRNLITMKFHLFFDRFHRKPLGKARCFSPFWPLPMGALSVLKLRPKAPTTSDRAASGSSEVVSNMESKAWRRILEPFPWRIHHENPWWSGWTRTQILVFTMKTHGGKHEKIVV